MEEKIARLKQMAEENIRQHADTLSALNDNTPSQLGH